MTSLSFTTPSVSTRRSAAWLAALVAFACACSSGQTGDPGLGNEAVETDDDDHTGDDEDAGATTKPSPTPEADDDTLPDSNPMPTPDSGQQCDPYHCDCGVGSRSSGSATTPATCIGTPLCNDTNECPSPSSGDVEPVCENQGDVVINGFSGRCKLFCDEASVCPDGSECIEGACAVLSEL